MVVGFALCAPGAMAQVQVKYKYTGVPFISTACSDMYKCDGQRRWEFGYERAVFEGQCYDLRCVNDGNVTALVTLNLPSLSFSGSATPTFGRLLRWAKRSRRAHMVLVHITRNSTSGGDLSSRPDFGLSDGQLYIDITHTAYGRILDRAYDLGMLTAGVHPQFPSTGNGTWTLVSVQNSACPMTVGRHQETQHFPLPPVQQCMQKLSQPLASRF